LNPNGTQKSLLGKLEAAKLKAAEQDTEQEFEVTITETFKMKVTVTAQSQCEAEQIVEENWNNTEYLIDSDHFAGAKFDAVPVAREISARGEER
jgi:hypothetical protein